LDGGLRWIDRYTIRYSPGIARATDSLNQAGFRRGIFEGIANPTNDLPLAGLEVARGAAFHGGSARVRTGDEATVASALNSFATADWVHFAGHGKQSLADLGATGLQLARSSGEDDSFLSLARLLRDAAFSRRPTVVLSACETGALTPRLSGDVLSLAGGFLHAGAGAVVSSYWQVLDACACLVMCRLYDELARDDASLAKSLRTAMLWARDLSEAEIHERLDALITAGGDPGGEARRALATYGRKRADRRPFAATYEWAGFSLVS
jgi:CHAT domain-containing protein